MLETSARLLRLLSLFQGRKYWSGGDLAAKLEITSRTLRRDVDKLRSLGYPIHSTSGTEGGYQLGAGSTMPPLLLDDEEAVAVAVGLRLSTTGIGVEGIEEASVRALAKMEQLLPPRLGRRVAALQSVVVMPMRKKETVDADTLSKIASACRDAQMLRFRYQDHGGTASARLVEPHRLVNAGRRWYLVAWDTGRDDWRTFRVDRIQQKLTVAGRFQLRPPPARDMAAYISQGVSKVLSPFRARVKLMAAATVMAERLPTCTGTLEVIDANTCYFDVGSSSYESLAMYLALLGVDFVVVEPIELVHQIRRLAEGFDFFLG